MLRMKVLRAALIVIIAGALASCHASYPFQPTPATPTSLQVFYRNALGPQPVGASFSLLAYIVNSDGAYEEVTARTSWSSSNAAVVGVMPSPSTFAALAPGVADVSATFQGLASTMRITVYEPERQFPILNIFPGDPHSVGQTASALVSLRVSATQTAALSAPASWSSSDSGVITVTPTGNATARVRAVRAGTAQITVSFNGLSTSYGVSVLP